MCDRSPLFLLEAKIISTDLLKRSFDLFDLFLQFVEAFRLDRYISEREHTRDYRHFSLSHPCQLNYTILSDLDTYIHRLYSSCRLTKSSLRSLHAARVTSSNAYIVIDDEIHELSRLFQLQINRLWRQFPSIEKEQEKRTKTKQPTQIINTRYHSQRMVHSSQTSESFVFLPETTTQKNNSQQTIPSPRTDPMDNYRQILILFRKISQFFRLLIEQLYGVHLVRDSHILQPIVISIIQLLLSIANELKENLHYTSSMKTNRHQFRIQQHEGICHVPTAKVSKKLETATGEVSTSHDSSLEEEIPYDRNDNHLSEIEDERQSVFDFDEDEFYRLANLQRDD